MTVRNFDGSSDVLALLPGALGSSSLGPFTLALLLKPMENLDNAMLSIGNGFTTGSSSFSQGKITVWPGNSTSTGIHTGMNNSTDLTQATVKLGTADGWTVVAVTKASGTATPRIHKFPIGGTVARANVSASIADVALASTDRILLGKDEFVNKYGMRLAVAAFWNVAMTDTQVDALWANLRTTDWSGHAAGAPLALWEFTQASTATAVTDLMGGGADQTAIAGTTVVTGDDPPGWTFGTVLTTTVRPSSSSVAGGWTASSGTIAAAVSDQTDTTYISGTAA